MACGDSVKGKNAPTADSDVPKEDKAVHSWGANMACVNQAVTHAITMQCCINMRYVQVACSVWT